MMICDINDTTTTDLESWCFGPQPFFVQLRDFQTHKPLPGIEVFDIGPKQGYEANDNGALRFSNVRIPRRNMLNRFCQLSKDGEFSFIPGSEKVAYSTMLRVRLLIVMRSGDGLSRAVTIATRYSIIRRQFREKIKGRGGGVGGWELPGSSNGGDECQVLDYPIQQHRLFPFLATSYLLVGIAKNLHDRFVDLMRRVNEDDFSTLKEVHALVSVMKCLGSWWCLEGIEASRRACGGYGYLRSCGLPDLYNRMLPMITYEGENYVLLRQTTRFLANLRKSLLAAKGVKRMTEGWLGDFSHEELQGLREKAVIPPICHFLQSALFERCSGEDVWKKFDSHLCFWQKLVKWSLFYYSESADPEADSVRWMNITITFGCLMSLTMFKEWVDSHLPSTSKCPDHLCLRHIMLNQLGVIFSCWNILEKPRITAVALISDLLGHHQLQYIHESMNDVCKEIRPGAIFLTDAFHHSDFLLHSTLGRADGNVYEALFAAGQRSDLNVWGDVTPAFSSYLSKL